MYFAQEYGAELRKIRAMAVDKSSRGRKRRSDANDTSTTGDNSTAAAADGGGGRKDDSTENSASSGNKCDKDDVDSASAGSSGGDPADIGFMSAEQRHYADLLANFFRAEEELEKAKKAMHTSSKGGNETTRGSQTRAWRSFPSSGRRQNESFSALVLTSALPTVWRLTSFRSLLLLSELDWLCVQVKQTPCRISLSFPSSYLSLLPARLLPTMALETPIA